MHSRSNFLLLGVFIALLTVLTLPGAVESQPQNILEGARKEGKLLLYTSLTIHEIDEIARPFLSNVSMRPRYI
jgi:hypothetical protein